MTLKVKKTIEIPGAADSGFDHGAFDPKTCRLFIAHTARNSVDVIDHDRGKHIATLPGFKEAVPDATFFNPVSSLVHVAIGDPGLVQTVNPKTGERSETMTTRGAHITALAQLYVFSSLHRGALVLNGA